MWKSRGTFFLLQFRKSNTVMWVPLRCIFRNCFVPTVGVYRPSLVIFYGDYLTNSMTIRNKGHQRPNSRPYNRTLPGRNCCLVSPPASLVMASFYTDSYVIRLIQQLSTADISLLRWFSCCILFRWRKRHMYCSANGRCTGGIYQSHKIVLPNYTCGITYLWSMNLILSELLYSASLSIVITTRVCSRLDIVPSGHRIPGVWLLSGFFPSWFGRYCY